MAVVSINATPWISEGNVSFVFNHHEDHLLNNGTASGADAVQVRCAIQNQDGDADADLVDIDTACDPQGQRYGTPSAQYDLTLRYTPELYEALLPFSRSTVSFATLNDFGLPVGVGNAEESGEVRFPQMAPETHYLNNENKTMDLALIVVGGVPTRTTDPGAAVWTHPAGPALP